MPRTRVVKRRSSAAKSESQENVLLLQQKAQLAEENLKALFNHKKLLLEETFKALLMTFGSELNKTVGEAREEYAKKIAETNRSATSNAHNSDSSLSQKDDGYVTDAVYTKESSVKKSRRVSRSLSRTNYGKGPRSRSQVANHMGPPITKGLKRSRSSSTSSSASMRPPSSIRSRYNTPANRICATPQYPPITPKIVPDTPLTVLRRPRQGETVVSLQGSPLMVNSTSDFQVNCNIPLTDGTILSLLPNKFKESAIDIPVANMHPETAKDLKTIHNNLQLYLKLLMGKQRK